MTISFVTDDMSVHKENNAARCGAGHGSDAKHRARKWPRGERVHASSIAKQGTHKNKREKNKSRELMTRTPMTSGGEASAAMSTIATETKEARHVRWTTYE